MAYTPIDNPTEFFNTVLYTGTGSALSVTGANFQPNMTWVKRRNAANGHLLQDSVRGATNVLFPDGVGAEVSGGTYFTSFDSDGFTVTNNAASGASGGTYASWNWLAGGTAVSNTAGSITSSVSANTDSGFSIVSFTGNGVAGATIGHGLGVTPAMMIIKNRIRGDASWLVYSSVLGNTKGLGLNLTTGAFTDSTVWNNTSPDVDKFAVGTNYQSNGSTNTMIAYCFAEVKGFSKFGSYTGNGSTDGSFVYTGFSPAFVMIKNVGTSNWTMHDNKRNPYNQVTDRLYANLSNAEDVGGPYGVDFLSNGMKMRTTESTSWNGNGVTFIYMAFAEQPFVTSTKTPTTAR